MTPSSSSVRDSVPTRVSAVGRREGPQTAVGGQGRRPTGPVSTLFGRHGVGYSPGGAYWCPGGSRRDDPGRAVAGRWMSGRDTGRARATRTRCTATAAALLPALRAARPITAFAVTFETGARKSGQSASA